MIQTVHIYNAFLSKKSYYNNILYKYEFKIQFFNAVDDERDAAANHGQYEPVLSLDNVYAIYLMEKDGGSLKYNSYGHMMKYYCITKITSKLQCNFQSRCARINKQNKNWTQW